MQFGLSIWIAEPDAEEIRLAYLLVCMSILHLTLIAGVSRALGMQCGFLTPRELIVYFCI